MALYNAPYDPRQDKYGQMGEMLGSVLGGLGGYAMQEFQKPQKIKEMVDSGYFTQDEAKYAVNLPPQQISQIVQQKMKLQQQRQADAAIAGIFGGGAGGSQGQQQPQLDLSSLPGGDIAQRLGSLGGPQQMPQQPGPAPAQGFNPQQEQAILNQTKQMTPEQIDQVLQSPQIPMGMKTQIYNMLDKERAHASKMESQEKDRALRERGLEVREESPQRTQMIKDVAEIEKSGRAAKNLIPAFKNLKVASRDPNLRTGLWKQLLDRFGFGEMGQAPISFVVDKMIQDINFASASSTTTPGKMTSSLLKNLSKSNPSVFSEPEGIEAMADLKIYGAKIQEEVQKQIDNIRDKSPRGLLPLDTISKAYKKAEPRIKKLHEKELRVVERLSEQPIKKVVVGSIVKEIPKGQSGKARDKLTGEIIEF